MMRNKVAYGLLAAVLLSGCGNSSVNGTLVGQVKKVSTATPMFCSGYREVDISLGVMRNGTGSMSTQDMWLTIGDHVDNATIAMLEGAAISGAIVDVTYDTRRAAFCTNDYILTNAVPSK